ncbi:hypothetical protein D1BOALGB6SA_1848 [Olavius sp. associated proteobacterium Delta 1]|nr:hypothetical protein D1BOALGB6SA_1848 [Olavius sp. associated proteobacterium Delta 1]
MAAKYMPQAGGWLNHNKSGKIGDAERKQSQTNMKSNK